jgi:hypothetical protein
LIGATIFSRRWKWVERNELAKIVLPGLKVLNGKMNKKLKKILMELIKEGKI